MNHSTIINCIKKLNPDARVIVRGTGDDTKIEYTESHKGIEPTLSDCQGVLGEVEIELAKIEENRLNAENEKEAFKGKTLSVKEQWVKDRLQATSLDIQTKVELGKIFKKLIAFID